MRAMIMAAGRGERMRPLTDQTPKPLLTVAGKPLIQYHIEALVRGGFTQIIVNVAWLGDQLVEFLGDGSQFGAHIEISPEPAPLESGGGLVNARHFLGDQPFIAVNGDTFCDYDYAALRNVDTAGLLGHIVLVPNPSHNPSGDFGIGADNFATLSKPLFTFSGVRIFDPKILDGLNPGCFSIVPRMREAIAARAISAELYTGEWVDVGTPERLALLNASR